MFSRFAVRQTSLTADTEVGDAFVDVTAQVNQAELRQSG
jgi:hypothetical protein